MVVHAVWFAKTDFHRNLCNAVVAGREHFLRAQNSGLRNISMWGQSGSNTECLAKVACAKASDFSERRER